MRFLVFALFGLLPAANVPLTAAETNGFESPDGSLYLQGRFVYERNCLTCHGRAGHGDGEMAAGMFPKPRPFASGIFKYGSTPPGYLPTTADLERTVRAGIHGTSMPAFANLSDRDIRAVVEYIKFFSSKWRKPEHYAPPLRLPPLPEWFADASIFAKRAEVGRELFLRACAICHGDNGDGHGTASAHLEDEWGHPSIPADLREPFIRSGSRLEDIYKVLLKGIPGSPMPSFSETLTDDQRWDLVAYVQLLRRQHGGTSAK